MSSLLVSISVDTKDTRRKSAVAMVAIKLVFLVVNTSSIIDTREMGIINGLAKRAVAIERM